MFRWFALVALVGAVGVSAFHRRVAMRLGETIARRREGPLLLAGRAFLAVPLFGGALLYVVHPPSMAWGALELPAWMRWFGVALGLATIPAVHWVLGALGRNVSDTVLTKEHHELVTAGPYRWVRHPLYTTGIALFLALGLVAASWYLLFVASLALVAIRWVVVPLEESQLAARFGAEYERYRRRTGVLLPRFRPQG